MSKFTLLLACCVLAQALCLPAGIRPRRSPQDELDFNDIDTGDNQKSGTTSTTTTTEDPFDDDDDFGESMETSPTTGGGSSIFSLLNLASALFPSSSGANGLFWNMLGKYIFGYPQTLGNLLFLRRKDVADNVIEVDYIKHLTPPFQKQEEASEEDNSGSQSDENDAAEESVEQQQSDTDKASKQESLSDDDDDSDYSDEPPGGGDGQGGGILGLIAGLSGGEDGQSDLGSLLAAVSGIVANLSGDGFDLNALIASGLGLVAGLLSEGEENPGAVIASYLLTSLDTITGGGSQNNGAFFGSLVSKLVKGTSAVGDESGSSEENKMPMSDSAGFFISLLMSLLGDMSKGSSGGSS